MRGKSFILAATLAVALSETAFAQTTTIGPGVRDDGWVSGIGGASFGSPVEPDSAFGVEYGDDVSPHVQAYLTLTYFENVMTQSLQDDIAVLSQELTAFTETQFTLFGRDQAVTFLAGGRYLFGSPLSTFRPYVGGGGGIINLKRTIADPRLGNITVAVLNDFGIGDLQLATNSTTKPLVEGALGVALFRGPLYVDIGYRFKRAFRIEGEVLDFSQAAIGVGYRF